MVKSPFEETEVPATRKQRLTLSIEPRVAGQTGHFRLTVDLFVLLAIDDVIIFIAPSHT